MNSSPSFPLTRLPRAASILLLLLAVGACSPAFNWREASDDGAHFVVLLPGKPASATRTVDLDGPKVEMHMTAAEAGNATFAAGTAELPDAKDATAASRALDAMATALLNNIGAAADNGRAALPGRTDGFSRTLDIDARGTARGRPLRLVARLAAKDRRVFQVLILGDDKAITDENIETFFGSFKPT